MFSEEGSELRVSEEGSELRVSEEGSELRVLLCKYNICNICSCDVFCIVEEGCESHVICSAYVSFWYKVRCFLPCPCRLGRKVKAIAWVGWAGDPTPTVPL